MRRDKRDISGYEMMMMNRKSCRHVIILYI